MTDLFARVWRIFARAGMAAGERAGVAAGRERAGLGGGGAWRGWAVDRLAVVTLLGGFLVA